MVLRLPDMKQHFSYWIDNGTKWGKRNLPYISNIDVSERKIQATVNNSFQRELFNQYQEFGESHILLFRLVKGVCGVLAVITSYQMVISGVLLNIFTILKLVFIIFILLFGLSSFVEITAVVRAPFPGFQKLDSGEIKMSVPCSECSFGTEYQLETDEKQPRYCANCGEELSTQLTLDKQLLRKLGKQLDNGQSVEMEMALFDSSKTAAFVRYPSGRLVPVKAADGIKLIDAAKIDKGVGIVIQVNGSTWNSIRNQRLSIDIVLAQEGEGWNVGLIDSSRGLIGTIGPKEDHEEFIQRVLDTGTLDVIIIDESEAVIYKDSIQPNEIDLGKLRQLRTYREYEAEAGKLER